MILKPILGKEVAIDKLRNQLAFASNCWQIRIQNDDRSVPNATMRAAKKCTHCGTSLRPNRRTPRNADSRKKAMMAS